MLSGSSKHLGEHGSRPLRRAPRAVRHCCVAPPLCRTSPPLLGPWCTSPRLRETSRAGHGRMSLRPRDREIRLGAPSARARNRVIPPPPRAGPLPHGPMAAPCGFASARAHRHASQSVGVAHYRARSKGAAIGMRVVIAMGGERKG